ncbi:MAG: LytTR family DNA-binding domain-containing protein [Bacteroidota bacterium]
MKILIIEDEPLAAERLQRIIKNSFPSSVIMGILDTVNGSVDFLKSKQPTIDLIFCDIHLADGSSFEIFKEVEVEKPIVFTTAYDQYSIEAFQHNSIHYLLKPLKESEVVAAFSKYEKYHKSQEKATVYLEGIKRLLGTKESADEKHFLVKSGMKLVPKKPEKIAIVYVENKVVHAIDIESKKKFLMDYTLDDLEENHLNSRSFFRVNRKQIINKEAVAAMKPFVGQRLELELQAGLNIDIIVSREKVRAFKLWFTG